MVIMKKIMFNDYCHFTEMVLSGEKTQTRRIISNKALFTFPIDGKDTIRVDMRKVPYKVCEIVAIAQRYEDIFMTVPNECRKNQFGWRNKMFVKADFMPHHIMIEAIRAERLQDISNEDCVKEGILENKYRNTWDRFYFEVGKVYNAITASTEKEAYKKLITRTCGNGIWERNPFVWVIDFHLAD
jgi:hypothetical protein